MVGRGYMSGQGALKPLKSAILQVKDLHKSYGKRAVLRGVSLTVAKGEVVAVMGENGSGKSTLLKILVGLLAPDAGEVWLEGRLGYCPQSLELYERLTVRENIAYFGAAYEMNEQAVSAASQRYLEVLKYSHYIDTKVSELSEGTKQKLNLTLALIHSPALLLLDEPYQGFDWETFKAFVGMLQEMRSEGKSVLLISHLITSEIRADRIVNLRDGVVHE